jgi:DUF971 family protein
MSDFLKGGEYLQPTNIHADRPGRTLRIEWGDGHRSEYGFTELRWMCPCAFCRGEAGMPGWLDSEPTLSEEQVTLSDISLVGHYAIQPVWADGHGTGFYTFAKLRDECPCPDDTARRAQEASGGAVPGGTASGHSHE